MRGLINKLAHVICVMLIIAGCGVSDSGSQILSPEDFKVGLAADTEEQLVDVRTPGEYGEGHLAGALNIDFKSGDFREQVDNLDKGRAVYIYCRSGGRSAASAKVLSELGFRKIFDLGGGYLGWEASGLPTEK